MGLAEVEADFTTDYLNHMAEWARRLDGEVVTSDRSGENCCCQVKTLQKCQSGIPGQGLRIRSGGMAAGRAKNHGLSAACGDHVDLRVPSAARARRRGPAAEPGLDREPVAEALRQRAACSRSPGRTEAR